MALDYGEVAGPPPLGKFSQTTAPLEGEGVQRDMLSAVRSAAIVRHGPRASHVGVVMLYFSPTYAALLVFGGNRASGSMASPGSPGLSIITQFTMMTSLLERCNSKLSIYSG